MTKHNVDAHKMIEKINLLFRYTIDINFANADKRRSERIRYIEEQITSGDRRCDL
jgi:hypothetical protein